MLTSAGMTLASPGAVESHRLSDRFVIALNSNDTALSVALLNKSLPIHLAPVGDVHLQQSRIGNPKLEFLPKFGRQIEAEFRGMIHRWKFAGSPLDNSVQYPMANWAQTVSGILMVANYSDFFANYCTGPLSADPIRGALAILGATRPCIAMRPADWAELAVEQGLAKTAFSPNERDTPAGRERSIGRIMTRHLGVSFTAHTETTVYRLRLDGGFRRWTQGGNPYTCYRFEVLSETEKPEDV